MVLLDSLKSNYFNNKLLDPYAQFFLLASEKILNSLSQKSISLISIHPLNQKIVLVQFRNLLFMIRHIVPLVDDRMVKEGCENQLLSKPALMTVYIPLITLERF